MAARWGEVVTFGDILERFQEEFEVRITSTDTLAIEGPSGRKKVLYLERILDDSDVRTVLYKLTRADIHLVIPA